MALVSLVLSEQNKTSFKQNKDSFKTLVTINHLSTPAMRLVFIIGLFFDIVVMTYKEISLNPKRFLTGII